VTAPYATANGRYVIQIVDAGEVAGLYLADYDPEYAGGQGDIKLTRHPAKAARFPSMFAALQCYQTVPESRRRRPDGKLNRPLTAAYTIQIIPREQAS
jgi:hypothetical protein